ncbi:hypothetical protein BRADI_3g02115v3 [Brachypodium distachyon]|uniref:Uncharacterized protein n=1 Tax=Brachypodium distachyon TaxID=15368 RepID=A0A2K2CUP9_BRADI|nr:hypothetical protein BRADI_3g02115v3 [Brachypodium distachyon]
MVYIIVSLLLNSPAHIDCDNTEATQVGPPGLSTSSVTPFDAGRGEDPHRVGNPVDSGRAQRCLHGSGPLLN